MFAGVFPVLERLNVMQLATPRLQPSCPPVIFNALIIVALIPLSLRGVKFRRRAAAMLRRNLLIYGLGGIVAPFFGIKIVDLFIVAIGVS